MGGGGLAQKQCSLIMHARTCHAPTKFMAIAEDTEIIAKQLDGKKIILFPAEVFSTQADLEHSWSAADSDEMRQCIVNI